MTPGAGSGLHGFLAELGKIMDIRLIYKAMLCDDQAAVSEISDENTVPAFERLEHRRAHSVSVLSATPSFQKAITVFKMCMNTISISSSFHPSL